MPAGGERRDGTRPVGEQVGRVTLPRPVPAVLSPLQCARHGWGMSTNARGHLRRSLRFLSAVRRARALALGLAGACALVGLAGCEIREAPALGAVLYEMDWTTTGIRRSPEGRGWRVRTDRGFEVELEAGWIVIRSIEMTACDHETAPSASPLVRLLEVLSLPEALAGHTGIRDPSASPVPVVADLARLEPVRITVLDVFARQYCRLHLLVARTGPGAVGLPPSEPMLRVSLVLKGRSWAARDPQLRPFDVRTSLANGRLFELKPPLEHDRDRQTVVRLEADPRRLFDGIDFAGVTAPEIARGVLANFVATLRLGQDRQ